MMLKYQMIRILKLLIGLFRTQHPDPATPAGGKRTLSRVTRIGLLGAHIGQTGGLRGKTKWQ